jgi:hypothetical protein
MVGRAGLNQRHPRTILTQPAGEDTASRTGADHHVIGCDGLGRDDGLSVTRLSIMQVRPGLCAFRPIDRAVGRALSLITWHLAA